MSLINLKSCAPSLFLNEDDRAVPEVKKSISIKSVFLFGAVFLVLIVMTAPASLLKKPLKNSNADFSYDRVTGTLWNGVFENSVMGGVKVGDVRFKTDVAALFTARAKVKVTLAGDDVFGGGIVVIRPSKKVSLKNAGFTVNLEGASRRYRFLGSALEGTAVINLTHVDYTFGKGCSKASGEARTDILHGAARAFNGKAFDLTGPLLCDDGILKLALSGQGEEGVASVSFSISPTFSYAIKADVTPERTEVSQALQLFGFEESPSGLSYAAVGVVKGI